MYFNQKGIFSHLTTLRTAFHIIEKSTLSCEKTNKKQTNPHTSITSNNIEVETGTCMTGWRGKTQAIQKQKQHFALTLTLRSLTQNQKLEDHIPNFTGMCNVTLEFECECVNVTLGFHKWSSTWSSSMQPTWNVVQFHQHVHICRCIWVHVYATRCSRYMHWLQWCRDMELDHMEYQWYMDIDHIEQSSMQLASVLFNLPSVHPLNLCRHCWSSLFPIVKSSCLKVCPH